MNTYEFAANRSLDDCGRLRGEEMRSGQVPRRKNVRPCPKLLPIAHRPSSVPVPRPASCVSHSFGAPRIYALVSIPFGLNGLTVAMSQNNNSKAESDAAILIGPHSPSLSIFFLPHSGRSKTAPWSWHSRLARRRLCCRVYQRRSYSQTIDDPTGDDHSRRPTRKVETDAQGSTRTY
jgi:hypothetical protein